eukprot:COSAG04_NODE_186_length_21024_cov_6.326069_16_plen_256_part_00
MNSSSRRIGLAWSASIAPGEEHWHRLGGDESYHGGQILAPRPGAWDSGDVSNAAPLIHPNGSVMLGYRAGGDTMQPGDAGIGIAFASAWNASYERRPGADGKLFGAEDGALWRDTAGKSRDDLSESSAAAHPSNHRGQGITTCLCTIFLAATTPAATAASGATHTQNRGWSGPTALSRRTPPACKLSRPAPSSCEPHQALQFCAQPAAATESCDRRVPAAQIPARAAEASARQRRRASRAVERRVALPQGGRRGR